MRLAPIRDHRIVLGVIVAALVPAFALTHTIVNRYKQQREDLAEEWGARGARDMVRHPAVAVTDFQTALSYDPENTPSRFQLAEALIRSSRFAEARAQLLTLWSEEPGNGEVNLELARLAAAGRDVTAAVRYYHAAIDGAWEAGGPAARRKARLELAKLLMSNGQNTQAQAELIATIDDLPADASLITNVGSLLVDAGADSRARSLFERALSVDPAYGDAARRLGTLEYRSGNYRAAARYLREAASKEALGPPEQQMLDVTDKILALDPSERGLTTRQRAGRVLSALEIARLRFERCRSTTTVDAAAATRFGEIDERLEAAQRLRERDLLHDPDLIDQTMDLVSAIEALPSSLCGQPTTDDSALQLIWAQRRPQSP